ncbi:hypothetical protein FOZ60_008148 [Perkinsus olseni]|uniref:Uncharacterized protein n=1 Tax=Perkinsus olseni TaxID=32597 RepID=A0A7J6NKZ2_PEROL|nr:hypothetical protein FOZ60_008148 [Perkinsus olseni]
MRPRRPLAAGYYISSEDVNFLGKSIRVKVHVRALDPTDDNRALMRVTIGGDGRDIEMPRYAEIKRYNALNADRFFIPGEIGGSNYVRWRECFTVERNEWSKVYFEEVARGLGTPPAAWVRPGFRLCPFGDSWVISLGRAGAYNLTYPVKLQLNEHAVVGCSAPNILGRSVPFGGSEGSAGGENSNNGTPSDGSTVTTIQSRDTSE